MDSGWRKLLAAAILLAAARAGAGMSGDAISWADMEGSFSGNSDGEDGPAEEARVIVVSKEGNGDSRTVQAAVDLVPHGNRERVKIFILPGVYREKVVVPASKPYISFIANESSETAISWHTRASDRGSNGQVIGTFDSATVAVDSDYFCAKGITFVNTATGAFPGSEGMQAVALRVSGDKAVFFRCRMLGSQDTLFDQFGRHYFFECYVQGSIDFIFGSARSLYQACTLHAVASSYGAIAASQRTSPAEDSGFSFINCRLTGSGTLYLGRAWGRYARVVYSYCQFDGIVNPEGWNDWGDSSRRRTAWFGEYNCVGRGADLSGRVPWARSLTYEEARPFLDRSYIDGYLWLRL
uniref:Pectinesterase n=1 Tax=Anthurium amnicola TaxID=1678845 RepID=A0A1D1Z2G3_9ARAE